MSSPEVFLLSVIVLSFVVTLLVRDEPSVILLVVQSPTYLNAYYSTEQKSFSDRQRQIVSICYALAVIAAVELSMRIGDGSDSSAEQDDNPLMRIKGIFIYLRDFRKSV
jgi:hypothetical protein